MLSNISEKTIQIIIQKYLKNHLSEDERKQLSHVYSQLNNYVGASVLGKYKWLFEPPKDEDVQQVLEEIIGHHLPEGITLTTKDGNIQHVKLKIDEDVLYETLAKGVHSKYSFLIPTLLKSIRHPKQFKMKDVLMEAASQIPQLGQIMHIVQTVKAASKVMKKPFHSPEDVVNAAKYMKNIVKQAKAYGGKDWLKYILVNPKTVKNAAGYFKYLEKYIPALKDDYMELKDELVKPLAKTYKWFIEGLGFMDNETPLQKKVREFWKKYHEKYKNKKLPESTNKIATVRKRDVIVPGHHAGIMTEKNLVQKQREIVNQVGRVKSILQGIRSIPKVQQAGGDVANIKGDIAKDGIGGTPYYQDKPLMLKIAEVDDNGGYKEIFRTNKMWLQTDAVGLQEKYQYIGSSIEGADALVFYGRRKPIHNISLAVPNRIDKEDNWWRTFNKRYQSDYRGSQLARKHRIIILEYEDVVVKGYILRMGYSRNANMPRVTMVTISFFEHEIEQKGSISGNNVPHQVASIPQQINQLNKEITKNKELLDKYADIYGKAGSTGLPKRIDARPYVAIKYYNWDQDMLDQFKNEMPALLNKFPKIGISKPDEIHRVMKELSMGNLVSIDSIEDIKKIKDYITSPERYEYAHFTLKDKESDEIVGITSAKIQKLRPSCDADKYIDDDLREETDGVSLSDDIARKLIDNITQSLPAVASYDILPNIDMIPRVIDVLL